MDKSEPTLIEASFAQAIATIHAAAELPEQTRRHWASSLRQIAKLLDRPPKVLPARYSAVRADLLNLHHAPAGMTPKTLQNHKSNAKSALLWLAREKGVPEHGAPLAPAWEGLRAKITDKLVRMRLSGLMRFASANDIAPEAVDEAFMDRLMAYRQATGQKARDADRRLIARAWNGNIGKVADWPAQPLEVPPPKSRIEVPWEDFPAGLRSDIEKYLETLTRVRKGRDGKRIRPAQPSTLMTRRRELQASARMALKQGIPIARLSSLAALLHPEVAEAVVDAFWEKNGEEPTLFTIDLANRFYAIALETKCLGLAECQRLAEIRQELQDHREHWKGLTDKNLDFLRRVLTPGVWGRVVKLPYEMIADAQRLHNRAPLKAAVEAQIAVAIAIESIAPVRLNNLTNIQLGVNLIKPGGPNANYWLVFPDSDVKNRVNLQYPLTEHVSKLIDQYVHEFWPTLLRGRQDKSLFPGMRSGVKNKISFGGQISQRILKLTGLRMTPHQFRHAAGAIILKKRPGEYELVRQLLGHKNIQTTINSYIGLETIHASEVFTGMISDMLANHLEAAE
ncbi:MAG: tyrosine-type recombinase/integrase [Pseudolabrys sp.]